MATINTSDLTQASAVSTSTDGKYTVTGTGVFDDLMEGVNAHLEAQFNLGRLTGAEYATVYLGAMQSSLQNSVQFILGKQQADKQAELLTKQILTEEKNTLDVTAGTTLKTSQNAEVLAGTTRNDSKTASDISVNTAQASLLGKQDLTEVKKTLDIVSTTSVRNATSTKDLLVKQEQIDMSVLQQATEVKNTLDVIAGTTLKASQNAEVLAGTTRNNAKNAAEIALSVKQGTKADAETSVLGQKEITEFAQTHQTTFVAPTASSIMGRQAELYGEQSKGFKWNADQKYLKTVLDAWSVNVASADGDGTGVYSLNTATVAGHENVNEIIEGSKPVV